MRLLKNFPEIKASSLIIGLITLSLLTSSEYFADRSSDLSSETESKTVEVKSGERVADMCARFEKQRITTCKELDKEARNFEASSILPEQSRGLKRFEGVFKPGSYQVTDTTAYGILEYLYFRAADRFLEETLVENVSLEQNDLSTYERMILASIVQKEAGKSGRYADIASVFLNRLKSNQVLGSCPTVEYALGYHRPFLIQADLANKSDYNVYKKKGLPPTPIAFFTDDAWYAAAEPSRTNFLFFVYDWTTSRVHFASNYQDHVKNASDARRNFVRRYGISAIHQAVPGKFYEL